MDGFGEAIAGMFKIIGIAALVIGIVFGALLYEGLDAMQHGVSGQHLHEYYLEKWGFNK